MLQGEHSAILSTFIKLPFVIKILVLSIFEWPFYTGLTVFAGLRSMKVGVQCESVVRFPRLFEKYPFPILINSAFLRLSDVFRAGYASIIITSLSMHIYQKYSDKVFIVLSKIDENRCEQTLASLP